MIDVRCPTCNDGSSLSVDYEVHQTGWAAVQEWGVEGGVPFVQREGKRYSDTFLSEWDETGFIYCDTCDENHTPKTLQVGDANEQPIVPPVIPGQLELIPNQ